MFNDKVQAQLSYPKVNRFKTIRIFLQTLKANVARGYTYTRILCDKATPETGAQASATRWRT